MASRKWLGVVGAGLIGVGIFAYWYDRKRSKSLAGTRYVPGRFAEAPQIDGYSDGNMTTTLRAAPDMSIEERIASIQKMIEKSVQDPEMRALAGRITQGCPDRDGLCEAKSIYKAIKKQVRYVGDIAPIKMSNGDVDGIDLYQSARRTWDMRMGDCLPAGTLLLTDRHELVRIEDLIIGSRIWGRDGWTEAKDVWFKGTLPVDVVHMNNGSSFKATGDHKVYVALCKHHPVAWDDGKSCTCGMKERSIERLRVSQLEPGMVLVQPDAIEFGSQEMDPRRAYIEGLYLSDGWCEDGRFAISGQDGCPKEAQKREVAELAEQLGIESYWHRKYVRLSDRAWAQRLSMMGSRAPNKHALSIAMNEQAAREMLRGILADSGKNTNGNGRTFTTTSRELMLQTRLLLRMCGVSCSERYIVDHGGAGEHPIWRLGIRDMNRSDGKRIKMLRVKEIDREVLSLPVYDIATADHYVYLPEADVVVSNCDDQTILAATLLASIGITPRLRVTAETKNGEESHIYPIALLPKFDPQYAIALDTTLPGSHKFGVEAPSARQTDYDA